MLKKINHLVFFIALIACIPLQSFAQKDDQNPPEDSLGNVTDVFQENFFEALKQRAIENYELALQALKKAEKGVKNDPQNQAVIAFERGKNYVSLKQYQEAEAFFLKTIEAVGNKYDVLVHLYELYFKQGKYTEAIPVAQKLISINTDYKEDLADLYIKTKNYDKALLLLDELDAKRGESPYRDALRNQIFRKTGNNKEEINKLVSKINKHPKTENEYLNLIYLYSQQGDAQKAFETAKELLKTKPKSEKVHLALYKFYLQEGDIAKSVQSLKIIAKSQQLDNQSKYRVLDDFLFHLNNHPEHQKYLLEVIEAFANQENNGTFYLQLGTYFLDKDPLKALQYFEKGVQLDPDNFELIKNTLLLQITLEKYAQAEELSRKSLEIFPSQPNLYLYNGIANNALQQWNKAINSLETGLDFLFDDQKTELLFYKEMVKVYATKGNHKKERQYQEKINQLQLKNK